MELNQSTCLEELWLELDSRLHLGLASRRKIQCNWLAREVIVAQPAAVHLNNNLGAAKWQPSEQDFASERLSADQHTQTLSIGLLLHAEHIATRFIGLACVLQDNLR